MREYCSSLLKWGRVLTLCTLLCNLTSTLRTALGAGSDCLHFIAG